jgi:hypothetical protein
VDECVAGVAEGDEVVDVVVAASSDADFVAAVVNVVDGAVLALVSAAASADLAVPLVYFGSELVRDGEGFLVQESPSFISAR